MPTISDHAITLRQWDFSETSQTVRLLTREHGAIRGLAKGARRERGMFSGGFEVCTRGQLVAIVKPGRDLATLTEWRLLEVFPAVRRRLSANRAALLAADLVAHLLDDADPHPEVHDGLLTLLRRLETPGADGPALLAFQWLLLDAAGYAPRLDEDVARGGPLAGEAPVLGFRPDAGGFTADPDAAGAPGTWRLRRSTFEAVRAAAAGSVAGSAAGGPGGDAESVPSAPRPSPAPRDRRRPHDPPDPATSPDPHAAPRPHDRLEPRDPRDPRDPHDPHEPPDPCASADPPAPAATSATADAGARPDPVARANRLLAVYARHVVGRELPAIEWAFGDG
jgi:DNA repair protein RecO (recombination protein O)